MNYDVVIFNLLLIIIAQTFAYFSFGSFGKQVNRWFNNVILLMIWLFATLPAVPDYLLVFYIVQFVIWSVLTLVQISRTKLGGHRGI